MPEGNRIRNLFVDGSVGWLVEVKVHQPASIPDPDLDWLADFNFGEPI